jgi:hypothetical protein
MASTFELVVEKLKGMGEQIPGGLTGVLVPADR